MKDGLIDKNPIQAHIPYRVLIENLDMVLEDGINPEVYMDGETLETVGPGDLERIREALDSRGLRLTLHGPYHQNSPGSPNEAKRELTAQRFRLAFAAASYLRPRTMVLHGGYDERGFKGDHGLWLSQSMKTWPEFVSEAERLGMIIAVENIFERAPDTLKTLVESVDSPYFKVCLDTGHLNVFSRVDLDEWISELSEHLAEVHLHDNGGRNDEHMPIGEGTFDFPLFFVLLRKYSLSPIFTIEQHSIEEMRRGLAAVKKFLR